MCGWAHPTWLICSSAVCCDAALTKHHHGMPPLPTYVFWDKTEE
jgi:hypothetical protein